ncbi:MAG: major facilitator superfamily 1 [Firmicutes bacterium]|nr:major facilitator superfamily 1 [Bacillota bacterium]
MTNKVIGRFTLLAYLMLVAIGAALNVVGVITNQVATAFGVDNATVGYCFSLFSVGYAIAILGNGFILAKVDVRKETMVASLVATVAVIGAISMKSLMTFSFFVFIYGLGYGVLCSLGYALIVKLYCNEAERSSKLNILNFFFSVGAIVTPILAGLALEHGISWKTVLIGTLLPVLAVILMALGQRRAVKLADEPATEAWSDNEPWNAKIYVIGLAMGCYVVSEMTFSYWVVTYMMEKLDLDIAVASMFLSIFWGFMAIGRFSTGVFIAKVNTVNYLLGASGVAFITFFGILSVQSTYLSMAMVAVLGLGYSGLYATLVAYGTDLLSRPSPKLTTFFLTIGAGAGILSFIVSSYIKQLFDFSATMLLSLVLMGAVFGFTFLVGKVLDNKAFR